MSLDLLSLVSTLRKLLVASLKLCVLGTTMPAAIPPLADAMLHLLNGGDSSSLSLHPSLEEREALKLLLATAKQIKADDHQQQQPAKLAAISTLLGHNLWVYTERYQTSVLRTTGDIDFLGASNQQTPSGELGGLGVPFDRLGPVVTDPFTFTVCTRTPFLHPETGAWAVAAVHKRGTDVSVVAFDVSKVSHPDAALRRAKVLNVYSLSTFGGCPIPVNDVISIATAVRPHTNHLNLVASCSGGGVISIDLATKQIERLWSFSPSIVQFGSCCAIGDRRLSKAPSLSSYTSSTSTSTGSSWLQQPISHWFWIATSEEAVCGSIGPAFRNSRAEVKIKGCFFDCAPCGEDSVLLLQRSCLSIHRGCSAEPIRRLDLQLVLKPAVRSYFGPPQSDRALIHRVWSYDAVGRSMDDDGAATALVATTTGAQWYLMSTPALRDDETERSPESASFGCCTALGEVKGMTCWAARKSATVPKW